MSSKKVQVELLGTARRPLTIEAGSGSKACVQAAIARVSGIPIAMQTILKSDGLKMDESEYGHCEYFIVWDERRLQGNLETSLPVQAAETALKELELEASLFDANLPNKYEAAAKKFSECLAVAGERTRN